MYFVRWALNNARYLPHTYIDGRYTPSGLSSTSVIHPSSAAPHNPYSTTTSSKPVGYPTTTPIAGPSTVGRYDPYASSPPRKTTSTMPVPFPTAPLKPGISLVAPPTIQSKLTGYTGMRFKPSPFFRVDQMVSSIMECPG